MAGFPSTEATSALIRAAVMGGADIIELGIPYSDPLADGPSIQMAAQRALNGGATFESALACVGQAGVEAPVLAFSYYNPLYARGLARAATDLRRAGFAGAIIPDLPPEEAAPLKSAFDREQLSMTFLVAPTTPVDRARTVAAQSSDFVYVVSRMGVTGVDRGIGAVDELVSRLHAVTDKPLAVGFGVSTPVQAAEIARLADAVVVGSALIDCIAKSSDPTRDLRLLCVGLREACNRPSRDPKVEPPSRP
jgi:tryptophan synthase alpha chain